jgi:uncharacterized protein (DUF2062 family)
MEVAPYICVVIPVYNHGLTVQRVVRGAMAVLPVIAVNDGSTDNTPAILAAEPGLTVVTLPRNQGKAAALRAGFAKADALGFTHAITLDADGQHPTEGLAAFAAACRREPGAFIVGVRDLQEAQAPWSRRATNALSNFWFRFETGVRLADTQCGYRGYPLAAVRQLRTTAQRYAFELEILVKAAWAGLPLLPQPVEADYAAPTSRLSHFRPWRDMAAMSWLHCRLATAVFCVPAPLRRLSALGVLRGLPPRHRARAVLRHLFSENAGTPARLAAAVGVGLFCGIAPIWGFQMLAAAALAHKFRLNKAIAVTASNVSFPLAAPFVLATGLALGHYLRTGEWVQFSPAAVKGLLPVYLCEWALGSVVLALLAGLLGGLLTFLVARGAARWRNRTRHD